MLTKLHYTLISIIIVLLVGIIAIATPVPPNGHPSSQISFGNDGSLELYSENDPTSYIDFHGTDNLDSDHIGRILSDDNNGFQFFTDISEIRMVIMKDGKVGIGTTQPLSLLNVQAPGEITTGTQKHWIFTAGGKFGDNSANSLVGIKIGGWPGEYNDVPLANRAVGVAAVAESNWANDVGMGLYTGGDQLGEYSEKVRITHDGNVGIGIASPTASLHIKSDAPIFKMTQDTTTWWTRTNNNAQQYAIGFSDDLSDSNIKFSVDTDGKVGIGTTQPLSLLNVQAPGEITTGTQKHWIFTAGGKFGDNSANSLVGIKIGGWPGEYNDVPLANRAVGVAAVAESNWANDVGMGLYTGGDQLGEYSEKVRITHDGNVGIGIASPTASLHIKSDAPIFKMTQDTTTWWTRTNNNAQQYAIGFSDDLSDSNIKFSVDTAGSVNLGNNLNMGGLTGALHVQKDPGNLNNADNILHINPFGAHPQVIINANAAKPVTIVGPLTVSDTITVQGHCFRPRTLTRCYKSPDHMTYVDNAGECTAAGFGVEGTVVILAQC